MNIVLNGELIATKPVRIVKSDEKVSEYLLDDGTLLKVRTVITQVFRFEGKHDVNGQPLYHVNWHVIPVTEPGEQL